MPFRMLIGYPYASPYQEYDAGAGPASSTYADVMSEVHQGKDVIPRFARRSCSSCCSWKRSAVVFGFHGVLVFLAERWGGLRYLCPTP